MIITAGGLQTLRHPDTGKLTPGVHKCTIAALQAYAATNARRRQLWRAFELWRARTRAICAPTHLWIGGSFITDEPEPSDVDVIAWMHPDAQSVEARSLELMTILRAARLDREDNVERTLGRLQPIGGLIDGFGARDLLHARMSWTQNWANDWDEDTGQIIPGTSKGIVEVSA